MIEIQIIIITQPGFANCNYQTFLFFSINIYNELVMILVQTCKTCPKNVFLPFFYKRLPLVNFAACFIQTDERKNVWSSQKHG